MQRLIIKVRSNFHQLLSRNRFRGELQDAYWGADEIDGSRDEDSIKFLYNLVRILEKLYSNPKTRIKDIADEIMMSERQFSRKLRNETNLTPSEYLRRFRLLKARKLLAKGKLSNYVAFEVGFSSQSYFCKCFKEQYEISPSQYIDSNARETKRNKQGSTVFLEQYFKKNDLN